MDVNYISPYIRVALDNTIYPNNTVYPRVIFDYELLYFLEGTGQIQIDTHIYTIEPQSIFLIKPGVPHAIFPADGSFLHQPHIHFDLFYRDDSPNTIISFKPLEEMNDEEKSHIRPNDFCNPPYDLPEKLQIRDFHRFEELFFAVIEEYQMKRNFYEINLKAKFLQLLVFILQEHKNNCAPYSPLVCNELDKIRDYICQNTQVSLTLSDLEKKFNISKCYLTRIFKQRFSISPIRYHQMIRMEKIKEVILYTNMSMTDIAEMFGYESVSVFSRAFRSSQGIAPTALRKSINRGS